MLECLDFIARFLHTRTCLRTNVRLALPNTARLQDGSRNGHRIQRVGGGGGGGERRAGGGGLYSLSRRLQGRALRSAGVADLEIMVCVLGKFENVPCIRTR